MNERAAAGKVYLVGAGPGDPGLLTLRAADLLAAADVVLYDRLVGSEILQRAKPGATLVPVGKKPGRPGALRQDRINRLLVRYARAGFCVVRLKGGDPFVFGRGGEEALALQEAGVAWEIVPGVSSFAAAPALAGIPVTHRGLSAGFGVFTGHEADPVNNGRPVSSGVPWDAAARLPTAVFLMGVGNLPRIAENLIAHGRSPHTPAAVVSRASLPGESAVLATLGTIAKRAQHLSNPAALIVGETAALAEQLDGSIPVHAGAGITEDEEELELALRGEFA